MSWHRWSRWLSGAGPALATLRQAGQRARGRVGEQARPADDACRGRGSERHLDHVDAVQRRVGIFLRVLAGAARQFLARAHDARARVVDVDVRGVLGIDDQGVRMRAAARLHCRNLPWFADVADVEDAHAAEPLFADRLGHAARATVHAPPRLLHGHEQQIAVHGQVPLAARTHHRRHELRLPGVLDHVGVEAVEVAHEHAVAAERQIPIAEREARPGLWRLRGRRTGPVLRRSVRVGSGGVGGRSGGVGAPAGAFGSKKPSGFGSVDTSSMLSAVCPASLNPGFNPSGDCRARRIPSSDRARRQRGRKRGRRREDQVTGRGPA